MFISFYLRSGSVSSSKLKFYYVYSFSIRSLYSSYTVASVSTVPTVRGVERICKWGLHFFRWNIGAKRRWSICRGRWLICRARWSICRGRWLICRGRWSICRARWSICHARWSRCRQDAKNSVGEKVGDAHARVPPPLSTPPLYRIYCNVRSWIQIHTQLYDSSSQTLQGS